MIASNGVGELYRIYTATRRDAIDFNLAMIGNDFTHPYTKPFDHAYMVKLFEHGLSKGIMGKQWQKVPPGFTRSEENRR